MWLLTVVREAVALGWFDAVCLLLLGARRSRQRSAVLLSLHHLFPLLLRRTTGSLRRHHAHISGQIRLGELVAA
jgi:hypothetical protein